MWIAAVVLWLLTSPFYIWNISSVSDLIWRAITLSILSICLISNSDKELTKRTKGLRILFFVTFSYYLFIPTIHGVYTFLGFISLCFSLCLVFFIGVKKSYLQSVFQVFAFIFSVSLLLSLISWILWNTGRLSLINMLVSYEDRTYYHFPFLIIEQTDIRELEQTIRFAGCYDEPGVVGTFCAMILCVNKFYLKKFSSIVCLLAGCASLSLFFFLTLAIYGVMYSIIVKRNYLIPLLFAIGLFAFYSYTKDEVVFYETLWRRFEFDDSEKKFMGDNRMTYEGEMYYKNMSTADYLFGGDYPTYIKKAKGSSSYKTVVVKNGAIFLVLYLLFFVLYGRKFREKYISFLLYLIVLFGNIYQRPDIFGIVTTFLYVCMARNILSDNSRK